jgi:hypothetical protein
VTFGGFVVESVSMKGFAPLYKKRGFKESSAIFKHISILIQRAPLIGTEQLQNDPERQPGELLLLHYLPSCQSLRLFPAATAQSVSI